MADFLYERDGDVFVPSELTGSPWSREHQHGGPVNALFAHAAEEAAAETGFQVTRLTVDLFKPVPRAPLVRRSRYARRGGRIANVESVLAPVDEDEPVCRAVAVLLKPTPGQAPSWEPASTPPPPPDSIEPVSFMPREFREHAPPGFHFSLEIRMAEDDHGPSAWITSPAHLLPGEPMSPLACCAAVADLTFGLSGRLLLRRRLVATDRPRVAMINTDTTLYLQRPPTGSWFGFRHSLLADQDGIGVAEVALYDEAGRLGRSLQAMIANEPRRRPAG